MVLAGIPEKGESGMKENVLAMAAALGKCESDEILETLCDAAVEALAAQLRPGVEAADCGEAFVLAAAWMALAQRELGDTSGGGVERFTAGAVTIQRGDANARREALLLQARQVMRPWLRDEGFSFRGVRG